MKKKKKKWEKPSVFFTFSFTNFFIFDRFFAVLENRPYVTFFNVSQKLDVSAIEWIIAFFCKGRYIFVHFLVYKQRMT